ncbi:CpsB/CapC family capsule biosynthesis tyrosine phosphatase [uncultured Dysosmobacter sp.]|uniref:CpsB/CapC family capsule biosynthesis tyrosine phosphatase n=1 Tax=uncultured Dysosmobacter sp. TaxID=2591384 RepID=UPI002616C55B|nr:CpsB/CapC family capsule biosynthesis tyrosine phosphatase [uncultured Dysosmobacter sp.]
MRSIADIHCHILPYVDDGAEHAAEMEKMLTSQAEQHVEVICFTPHLRTGMFTSSDEDVRRRFGQAEEFVRRRQLPIRLFLGREYYCNEEFLERLEAGSLLTLGGGDALLMEFSGRCDADAICEYIKRAKQAGYQPLAAHVERYPAIGANADQVKRLIDAGAKIQINASSLLGHEGIRQKLFCWKLMKLGLVDVVASDAHDPQYRPPVLGECAHRIETKMGQACAQKVLWDNPLKILSL